MTEDMHEKAMALVIASRVEGVSPAEREGLEAHLRDCPRCAQRAAGFESLLASLRSIPVTVDPAVVTATHLRIWERARELQEERSRMRALWVSCALSWILGAASAPLLWRGFAWAGRHLALPDVVWQGAFVLWWLVPAAVVGGVLAWRYGRVEREEGFEVTLPSPAED